MPRKFVELAGGTWTNVDLVDNHNALIANAAADTVQDTVANLRSLAMSGDMVLKCTPATLGTSAAVIQAAVADAGAGNKYTRTVTVTLETAAGAVHTWYSGSKDAAAGVVTGGNDTAALADSATEITFVNGSATATIDYTLTWAAADTCTLTVTGAEVMGITVADKTSVDTVVA